MTRDVELLSIDEHLQADSDVPILKQAKAEYAKSQEMPVNLCAQIVSVDD